MKKKTLRLSEHETRRLKELIHFCFGEQRNMREATKLASSTCSDLWNGTKSDVNLSTLSRIKKACGFFSVDYILSADYTKL